jgi:hypothetical protein
MQQTKPRCQRTDSSRTRALVLELSVPFESPEQVEKAPLFALGDKLLERERNSLLLAACATYCHGLIEKLRINC